MITLRIAEGVTPVLADWVENNKVDLAVLSLGMAGDREQSPGLRWEPLAQEDMVVVETAKGARPPRAYSLSSLQAKPLVLSDMLAMIVKRRLGLPELAFNTALEIDAVQALKVMVLRGQAASILPVSMLSEELRQGKVAGSAITARGVRRQLALAQPSYRQMTQATEAVRGVVKDEMAALSAEGAFSLHRLSEPRHRRKKDRRESAPRAA